MNVCHKVFMTRKNCQCYAQRWLGVLSCLFSVASAQAQFATYYVSPGGNDVSGDGSIGNPWQTIAQARDYIYTSGASFYQNDDIIVYLRGGRYPLTNTLAFGTVHSGGNGRYIVYKSYPGESATLSGGKPVTGWTQVSGKPYWVANVSTNAGFAGYFRQLYVNGVRAERARSDWIQGTSFYNSSATTNVCDGINFTTNSGLKSYSNVTDLRLLHIVNFKIDEFPITGITTNATNGLIQVELQQPYCQIRYDYPSYYFQATHPWMIVNAFEELDEPGEWYLNRATQQVFYYPYSFENMANAVVYAPVVEILVSFTGSSTVAKVQNIRFQGLTFEHGNWFFPRDYYIGGSQAEILYSGVASNTPPASVGYAYEVPGQIKLNNTSGIQFLGNNFQHLGSCGIHAFNGTLNTLIQGNTFYDLTGASVLGGRWQQDPAIPNQQICTNTIIANNVIRNIGMDFMAGTLVDNLQHYGFQALHNDMADAQYMGFHQRNATVALPTSQGGSVAASNRISLVMSGGRYGVADGGSIYSFGVFPNSFVTANDVYDLNQPTVISNAVNGLYQDGFSYGWTWTSNVVRNVWPGMQGLFLERCETNDPNVNIAIGNFSDATVIFTNGLVTNIAYTKFPLGSPPPAAQAIINAAGLESAYTNLMSRIYSGTNLALNKFVWASSKSSAAYDATNAVDWKYGTTWRSAANDTNSWWAVDLGAVYVVQRIELVPRIDLDDPTARQDFQVQAANNSSFTNYSVLSEQNATPFAYKVINLRNSWIKYLNNPNGYRYLRVRKTSGWNLNFSEFQVYGYPASAAATRLVWDAGASGGVTDGSGEWYAPNQWWNGSSDQAWADNIDAVIGNTNGAAGVLTVTGGSPVVNTLTFNPATSGNYVLTGNAIQFIGSNAIIANTSATISNNLISSGVFTKNGTGTITLAGSNVIAPTLVIATGSLSLGASGSLSSGSSVNVAAGGAFDVSSQAAWTLGSTASLVASGSGSAAQINGGTTVDLGSRPVTLNSDGLNPALTVASGALNINGGITVSNTTGSAFTNGTYTLINVNSGIITGTPYLIGAVLGAGIVSGATSTIQTSGTQLQLKVILPVVTATTISRHTGTGSSSAYGDALQFDVSVTGSSPTGTVTVKDGGASGTILGTATLSSGSATVALTNLTAFQVGSHANMVAVYGGDSGNLTSTSTPLSPAQSVAAKALTVSGAAVQSKYYDATTSATITGTLSGVVSGDTVTLIGTGAFANAGPGTNIAVTSTSTLAGVSAGNYTLTQPTGLTGTIYSLGTSSVWTGAAGTGFWETAGNWNNNSVPSSTNATADFSTLDITTDQTVNLTNAETIGFLIFGDGSTNTAAGWTLANNGNPANTLTLGGTAPTIAVNALGGSKCVVISNAIAGSVGLVKTGNGTLTLSASNAYTGSTIISAGTIRAGNANAFGINKTLTVQSGATLDLNGQSLNNLSFSITAGGSGVGGTGALTNGASAQANSFSNLVLTGDTTVSASAQFTVRVNDPGAPPILNMGGYTLTKLGSSTFALISAANNSITNPGNMVVSAGTLQWGFGFPGNGLAPGESNYTITVNNGATLDFYKSSAPNVTYNIALQNGATMSWSGTTNTGNLTGNITLNGTNTFLMNTNGTYKGVVGGTGNLVKTGPASLTLAATNTYSGNTTVNAGTLVLKTPSLATNSTVNVTNGAVLQLAFTATNQVKALVLNGVSQTPGIYNSITSQSYLNGQGSLQLLSQIPTTPTNLSYSVSSGVLTLSWPSNYLGWSLQVQTSSLTAGINTNWFTLPGSEMLTSTNLGMNGTNGAVFYRLIYQP